MVRAIAKAFDYSLKDWAGLNALPGRWHRPHREQLGGKPDQSLDPGTIQLAVSRTLRSSYRAEAIMSFIHSVKLNGHDPYTSPKDVLMRLPTQRNNTIKELLPHNWKPVMVGKV